ncbi:MAG: diaminopimelate decarboxylase [Candidatus Omnitrophica bacterium]|nr:diaminopimelate decarboxylase [Candidatus Omnitrophota bacterium]
MHDFKFKNNELYCESVKVSTIAKKVGTPFYLYSHKTLVEHFQKIKDAFASINPLVCFAMKSNGNAAIVKTLLNQGAGIDIVSEGELRKAIRLGANPKTICFASAGKTEQEITLAIKEKILLFNVESKEELEEINRIAKKLKKIVQIALRINPDIDAATHKSITTGTLKNKFGIDLKTARSILKNTKKYPNLKINGLHMHLGSQITTVKPYVDALNKIIQFLETLCNDGIILRYLDIGGGFGISYKNKSVTPKEFAKALLPLLRMTGLEIIIEPGRFIVGPSGIFVTKVLYNKDNGVKKFVIVDGGMNDFARPSLYNAYHEILPTKKTSAKKIKVDVVGPICESGDFFAKDRKLSIVKKNDLLAIMRAGAYGSGMASNYNIRPKVAEIMVKANKFEIIKKRETFSDLIRGEEIPRFLK